MIKIESIGDELLSVSYYKYVDKMEDINQVAIDNYFDPSTALKDLNKIYYTGYYGYNAEVIKEITEAHRKPHYKKYEMSDAQVRNVLRYIDTESNKNPEQWWKDNKGCNVFGTLFDTVSYKSL